MKKKEIKKIGTVFLAVLVLALYMDLKSGDLLSDGSLRREPIGGDTKTVSLILDVEGILDNYVYELEVEPQKVTQKQAEEKFSQAVKEIERDFAKEWKEVPAYESYADGLVEVQWSFSPTGYLSSDGTIVCHTIPEEGVLLNAQVVMECGTYQQIYSFPFRLEEGIVPKEEKIIVAIADWLEKEQSLEGVEYLTLPAEVQGVSVKWTEEKEWMVIKVFFLEVIALFLLVYLGKKKRSQEEMQRKRQAEIEYPEVVSQILVLLEAGMNTRQVWERIASQYVLKKKRKLIKEKPVYEGILRMNRRLQEGESERNAYRAFSEEVGVMCYRRLIRILLSNLEKGSREICSHLKEEANQAHEQRILLAKKLGEEAATKMLLPLMIMMVLVMCIVMMPAIIGFTI